MTGDPPPLLRGYRPQGALVLLVVAVYVPCAWFGLTLLDDNFYFEKQLPFLRDWTNLPSLFTRSSMLGAAGVDDYYRPLLILSIMIDVLLGGGSLAVPHLANVGYHAIATVLLFSMFRKLGYGDRSIVLAGLFAVHPVLAQSVAWIPGRTDSLLAVFVIASFNAFLDHVQEPKRASLARHLGFFALALLVKELAIVLPALCLLFAWGRLDRRRSVVLLSGWSILLTIWYVVRGNVLLPSSGTSSTEALTSVLVNLPAAAVYAAKCWLPLKLAPYPTLQDAAWPFAIGGVVLMGLVLAFRRPEQPRRAWWAAAWFVIFLLPSFIYPTRSITPVFFEYRAVLPLIGMLVLLGESGAIRSLLPWTALIAIFAAGAVVNSRSYRDAVPCWERAVEGSPRSAFAHKQLGAAYLRTGETARAEAVVRKALELNPEEPGAHNNLGTILLKSGRVGEAIGEYRRELDHHSSADACYNLGLAYLQLGRNDEAEALWKRTIEVDPGFVDAYVNLAALHVLKGDSRSAARFAREALRRGGTLPPDLVRRIPELSR